MARCEEMIIEPQCLLWTAAAVRQKERGSESERAHIHQAEPIDAQSLERGALEEAGGPQQRGASLVGGHQKKCFSLSDFQERAHFSVFPLTLCLMLYSSTCPPWTSVYCWLWLSSSEESLMRLSAQIKYEIKYTFYIWQAFPFTHFNHGCPALRKKKKKPT